MIKIEKIYVTQKDDKSILNFDLFIDKEPKHVWFEVEKEYEQYLCDERCDAIVIGLLYEAMRNGYDIVSNIPITEELLFNIQEYLIPSLTKYDNKMTAIQITAPTEAEPIKNAGGVGTGISCGVDSFHAIHNQYNCKYKSMALTHLCLTSVGSFHDCYEKYGMEKIRLDRIDEAKKIANLLNLPLLISNSNLASVSTTGFVQVHTYHNMFAVYCLQKLWKIYFYGSSGYDFNTFKLDNNSDDSCDKYELLSLPCFSTHNLHLYSEGGTKDRMEKTQTIVDDKLAKKHLHVCIHDNKNCGTCSKCRRTLLTLEGLGKLEEYSEVFDIEYYKKHKFDSLLFLYSKLVCNDPMYNSIYQLMEKDVTVLVRATYWFKYIIKNIFAIAIKKDRILLTILFMHLKINRK